MLRATFTSKDVRRCLIIGYLLAHFARIQHIGLCYTQRSRPTNLRPFCDRQLSSPPHGSPLLLRSTYSHSKSFGPVILHPRVGGRAAGAIRFRDPRIPHYETLLFPISRAESHQSTDILHPESHLSLSLSLFPFISVPYSPPPLQCNAG